MSTVCMSFQRDFILPWLLKLFICLQTRSRTAVGGGGGCKAESGQVWIGGGRGFKTGENVPTSFIDDP